MTPRKKATMTTEIWAWVRAVVISGSVMLFNQLQTIPVIKNQMENDQKQNVIKHNEQDKDIEELQKAIFRPVWDRGQRTTSYGHAIQSDSLMDETDCYLTESEMTMQKVDSTLAVN